MRTLMLLVFVFVTCGAGNTQKGTAPDGYYPLSYSGDTYTGTVKDTEDRRITLEYRNKSRTETFVGITTEPCMAPVKANPTTAKELHLTAIPKGSNITVLYSRKKIKRADGPKEEVNVVIGFWFNELNGEKLNNPPHIPCFAGGANFTHYGRVIALRRASALLIAD